MSPQEVSTRVNEILAIRDPRDFHAKRDQLVQYIVRQIAASATGAREKALALLPLLNSTHELRFA